MVNKLLYQIWEFTIYGKKIRKSHKNNKSKISAPPWNEEFELPDGSYSISDIREYFGYILRNMGKILMIIIILQQKCT